MISVCVACLCADADDFHRPKAKRFVCKLSSEKKKNACKTANVFFLARKLAIQKVST
jgi:hypothetical protein